MKTKISIVVEGGTIQQIKSNNKDIDLKIFDYDDAEITGTIKDLEKKEKIFNKYLKYNL